ncbi:hypothetical protein SUGI_0117450 [Cryptomeria japonica]|nr:hypothetical protein SUGI_0117450 [Cryptomeria japonica]
MLRGDVTGFTGLADQEKEESERIYLHNSPDRPGMGVSAFYAVGHFPVISFDLTSNTINNINICKMEMSRSLVKNLETVVKARNLKHVVRLGKI